MWRGDHQFTLPLRSTRILPSILCALLVGTLLGCATPAQQQAHQDWEEVCRYAPHTAGQEIGLLEQRAMTRQDLWRYSVEELDRRCAERR